MMMTFLMSRLMRHGLKLAVVGLLALATVPAHAEYMGGGSIFSPYNCSWPTNVEMTRARYIPGETADGTSHVTLNFAVGGLNSYAFSTALTPSRRWLRGEGQSVWGQVFDMASSPRVRVIKRQNAVYTGNADMASSDSIRLRLRVRNFNGEQGCSVTVALMLHRWD